MLRLRTVSVAILMLGCLGCMAVPQGTGAHVAQGPCRLTVLEDVGLQGTQRVRLTPPYRVHRHPTIGLAGVDYLGTHWRLFEATIVAPDGSTEGTRQPASAPGLATEFPPDYPMLLSQRGSHSIRLVDAAAGCLHEFSTEVY